MNDTIFDRRRSAEAERRFSRAPIRTFDRILITGGNGYVGRRLTRILSPRYTLCVVDNLRSGPWRFSNEERRRLRLEAVDIRDDSRIKMVIDDFIPDVVIHLAAIHYIPECESNPPLAVSTNISGTVNLLASCHPGSRFIFASSGAVYQPEDQPHREDSSILGASDVYGRTKLQAEEFVSDLAQKYDLEAVIVRLFNVVGPGETNPHLLPEVVAQLKAGRNVIELGNLTPRRDYIHVHDAAEGFAAIALGCCPRPGESLAVNLGTSQTSSVEEILDKFRAVSGLDFKVTCDTTRLRKVDRPFLAADIRRIAEYFQWRPKLNIDDAVRDLWNEPDLATRLTARYV